MNRSTAGIVAGVAGQLIWGLFPAYWRLLAEVPPFEVLLHRIVWSFLLLIVVVRLWNRQGAMMGAMKSRRMMGVLSATTLLITSNWLVFIWASTSGRVLDISLGFFMTPLVNVVLGMIFLGERLRRHQAVAVLLAAAGVVNLSIAGGTMPWVALFLAFSFGLYGLLRKANPVDPILGLTIETGLLAPLALACLAYLQLRSGTPFGPAHPGISALLVLAGAVTAIPLLLFVFAAHRLRYVTIGLLQYISPSLHFLLAVILYAEKLTPAHMLTFACIWCGLFLYIADSWRAAKAPAAA